MDLVTDIYRKLILQDLAVGAEFQDFVDFDRFITDISATVLTIRVEAELEGTSTASFRSPPPVHAWMVEI